MAALDDLVLRTRYADDRALRAELVRFIFSTFRLDLGPWDDAGYWDERYVPFSFFRGDRIVASACSYSMEMVIDGQRTKVAQLSGVGTVAEHRRQGLNRRLVEEILAHAASTGHGGAFLFADADAVPFYERFGFRSVEEHASILSVGGVARRHGLRKLDMARPADRDRVFAAASARTPVSSVLGVLNAKLFMFHALCLLSDHVYEVADLGVIVVLEVARGRLTLYDVVGPELPTFAELHPYLATSPHDEVLFHFEPDRLDVEPTGRVALRDNGTHVLAPFGLPRVACTLPFTCHA